MAIIPVAVQAFALAGTFSAGTYTLINGVQNEQIRFLQYNVQNTGSGTVTLQDSAGIVIAVIPGHSSIGSSGIVELTPGASFEAILGGGTTVDCYFVGFLQ